MKVRVLGSSGGWPAASRACSGYLVSERETSIWLDAGAGTLAELLRHGTLDEVAALWISHLHPARRRRRGASVPGSLCPTWLSRPAFAIAEASVKAAIFCPGLRKGGGRLSLATCVTDSLVGNAQGSTHT
jgi:hypothetical protein